MAEKNMNAKISVEFEETANRQQLSSGDNLPTLFGKIKKFFTDLKTVAFSGSYIDLSDTPTTVTTTTDGLMSAEDKGKLDSVDDTYALKAKYGDTTIDVGRKADTTVGFRSTAEGYITTASGTVSHAEGQGTTASKDCAHAEGNGTTASGSSSHAEGNGTTASGSSSHAEGDGTTASGNCSHAGGTGTKALHNNEAAYGQYNQSNDDTLFSIGDGTSDSARHNAFEITTTGGKLHDKDIATTDMSLKANGGNADTVGEKSADDFPQIIDLGWNETDTKNAVGKSGKTTIYKCANWTDFPVGGTNGQGTLIAINFGGEGTAGIDSMWLVQLYIAADNGIIYKRYISHTILNSWVEMYSGDDKPYVTGSATVAANSTTCTSNHGFTPSAVIWWDGNSSGVAVSFNDTQFVIDKTGSVDRAVYYMIFK